MISVKYGPAANERLEALFSLIPILRRLDWLHYEISRLNFSITNHDLAIAPSTELPQTDELQKKLHRQLDVMMHNTHYSD